MSNLPGETIKNFFGLEIQAEMSHILSKQPILEPGHLRITSEWLFTETAIIFGENSQIGECAWTYLVLYFLAVEIKSLKELELVSWTCLSLASRKFNLNTSLEWILKSINHRSNAEELLKTHLQVYEIVKHHQICLVSDVIDCLLEFVSYSDTAKIKKIALIFSDKVYREYNITSFLRAGLAAILWALGQLQLEYLQSAFDEIEGIKQEVEKARQMI